MFFHYNLNVSEVKLLRKILRRVFCAEYCKIGLNLFHSNYKKLDFEQLSNEARKFLLQKKNIYIYINRVSLYF